MKTVSVVIPAYNREKTIKRCVLSALSQDVDDLEVIVVDDGSTDGTSEIVMSINDNRVRLLKQINKGANAARNAGIDIAEGRYIALLDSDDVFCTGHLNRSITALEGNPKSVAFSKIIVDRGNGISFEKPPRGPKIGEPISEYLSCDRGFIQTSTLVFPTYVSKEVRYLEWLPYGQDVDFACRISHAGYDFVFIDTAGAIWSDVSDAKRISAKSDPLVRMRWASENRELLTDKAFNGFVGWRVAKAHAENGALVEALKLYCKAVFKGTFYPKHAAIIFLQIMLASGHYRKLTDAIKRILKR